MKGIVFTEFLEMVEDKFGFDVVDDIIDASEGKLSTDGAYTSVGIYSYQEMFTLVGNLSTATKIPISKLLQVFGEHLLGQFVKNYPDFFKAAKTTFDFLESIDNHIHVEVLKLYPDAELPTFSCFHTEGDVTRLTMIYTSERAMGDLASGLIEGAIKYYNENITVEKELIGKDGKKVKFELVKHD